MANDDGLEVRGSSACWTLPRPVRSLSESSKGSLAVQEDAALACVDSSSIPRGLVSNCAVRFESATFEGLRGRHRS